jgi:hypothetical protein
LRLGWQQAEISFETVYVLQRRKGEVDWDASIMQYEKLHYCRSAV